MPKKPEPPASSSGSRSRARRWPSLEEQLAHSRVVHRSALEKLM